MEQPTTGSDAWWQVRAAQGGPTIAQADNGHCDVTFWWRDPDGDEQHSPRQRVWIYITGVTDHHNRSCPQSLTRLPGTDVWHWQTRLPANWRGSYCFIPSSSDSDFLPGAFNPDGADSAALRAGWGSLLPQAMADPLNPHGWQGGRGYPTSALHLPNAPPQPGWDNDNVRWTAPVCLQWHSTRLGNQRRVWVFTTGDDESTPRPLALLLDGQFWAESMPVWPALSALTHQRRLPPAVYVLIDAIDIAQRAIELPCNAEFWQAVIDELLPQVRAVAPWNNDPTTTLVAGQSFGGLAALYVALHFPQQFGRVLSQSGSFWWLNREGEQGGGLLDDLEHGRLAWSAPRLWLEAGKREPLIHTANLRLRICLQQNGQPFLWREVEGGHDALCWRGGLTDGLMALWRDLLPPSASEQE